MALGLRPDELLTEDLSIEPDTRRSTKRREPELEAVAS